VLPFPDQARLRWRANPWQPRRGARRALRAETAGLRVYSAHIESGTNDACRRKPLAHLAAEEEAIATSCTSLVIAGDFNCGAAGRVLMLDMLSDRGLVDALNGDPRTRRTAVRRTHALDWILVRQLDVSNAGVGARLCGSDQFPVWATVRRPTVQRTE
jgi:endonuclease/exonuclease/phosphatase family metal-dependent hydrolase